MANIFEMLNKLRNIVKDRIVQIVSHWDTDGITSAALVYHLIRDYAKKIYTKTKGKPFLVEEEDINEDAELLVAIDIIPSNKIKKEIIYIDHHPSNVSCKLKIHDENAKSASLLIYEKILEKEQKENPYFIFLTILGFVGDNGKINDLPIELKELANEKIPDLMKIRKLNGREFYEIERFAPLLNSGKRHNWSGDIPLELLKCINSHEPLTVGYHPLAVHLYNYKDVLKHYYFSQVDLVTVGFLDYAIISCDKNIQGVLAARYMKERPIMVMNKYNGEIIGSLRVPENFDFDAGEFLSRFRDKIPNFVGGGHEKAGGFSFDSKYLELFLLLLKENIEKMFSSDLNVA